jgi:predicted nucleic-acid-binding Zn-ribbon protein
MNANAKSCLECGGATYFHMSAYAGGGHGPYFLPGLGGFLRMARFKIVVCGDCWLTRFYAEPDAVARLSRSKQWSRL